jgi:arylsulfatase A-like enzyme
MDTPLAGKSIAIDRSPHAITVDLSCGAMKCEGSHDGAGRQPAPSGSTRREFVRRGGVAAGAVAIGALDLAALGRAGVGRAVAPPAAPRAPNRRTGEPNILVIVVDEMRAPSWFPPTATLDALLPNIAAVRRGSVSFEQHFTVSNNCTPSRGALLTGLYSHQTGCLITGRSELEPGFPTWGTMLREHGYETTWWGKWHLSRAPTLEPWGFSGGTFPSPNGGPGQGVHADPAIASQFETWLADAGGRGPWCTTVSFVNPHDIVWWWAYTRHYPAESSAPRMFSHLPGNFETPAQLTALAKPRLQPALQVAAAAAFGAVPFTGPEAVLEWCEQRDLYLKLQRDVDVQVGRVLRALAARPAIRDNTIVIFTSDHGEYGGSHGLRGKGGAVYDEGIQVPLYVSDPRGKLTRAVNVPRRQLTSSGDIAPLLLTIAAGSNDWRRESRYAHLAGRADLAAICADPHAAGRPWIAHATDEVATEFAPEPYAASAPRHVLAVRTSSAKYAVYSNWRAGTLRIEPGDEDVELYEYSTAAGRLELDNMHGRSAAETPMRSLLMDHVVPRELAAPLPRPLRDLQARGQANFLEVSRTVDAQVAARVARRLAEQRQRSTPSLVPQWQPEPFPTGGHAGTGRPRR